MNIKCPTCKKAGDWFSGPSGPFCSRRCKMVDLGKWFSEEHLISSPIRQDETQGNAEPGWPLEEKDPGDSV